MMPLMRRWPAVERLGGRRRPHQWPERVHSLLGTGLCDLGDLGRYLGGVWLLRGVSIHSSCPALSITRWVVVYANSALSLIAESCAQKLVPPLSGRTDRPVRDPLSPTRSAHRVRDLLQLAVAAVKRLGALGYAVLGGCRRRVVQRTAELRLRVNGTAASSARVHCRGALPISATDAPLATSRRWG